MVVWKIKFGKTEVCSQAAVAACSSCETAVVVVACLRTCSRHNAIRRPHFGRRSKEMCRPLKDQGHPLKGQGQRINTSLSGFILLRSNICTTPFITSTRLSMHPVFRSAGCRAGLHQSSIGIKAKAGVLAFAPGSGRAPENHRYQTGVHGSIHQSACCVSSARLISAHGLGIPAVADWGTAGARGPITSLGSRQHIYRAHA
jgi:hypothetical protein